MCENVKKIMRPETMTAIERNKHRYSDERTNGDESSKDNKVKKGKKKRKEKKETDTT